ncbi:hypothetical protein ACROYT_G000434 [Oculina patagonica]
MKGPDLINSLIGVLTRFRVESTAIMADIEKMFYQVRVPTEDANYLRFLSWPGGDMGKSPEEFQMLVHLFGGVSSPSCASYALRKTADDNLEHFDEETVQTVRRNFYVDDCLKSVKDDQCASRLADQLCQLLAKGGFRLTKWILNSCDVIQSVPVSERAGSVRELDLENLHIERAFGIQWDVQSDTFRFKIVVKDRPPTRRGILSVISSIYDPLGFVAPLILPAKIILRDLCQKRLDWDDRIPPEDSTLWEDWLQEPPKLEQFTVKRCVKPTNFGRIVSSQLHSFADASQEGYGAVTYLRVVNEDGDAHCAFLIGKSRQTPQKSITIPRLELSAAVVATNLNKMMRCKASDREELSCLQNKETDAKRTKSVQTDRRRSVKKSSSIVKLDPELRDGLLCVGGRLRRAPIEEEQWHPVILPKKHHVVDLIIRHYHLLSGHSGQERRQAPVGAQKMSDLPADRVTPDKPPFSFVGVDCFGPFWVKRARSQVKRYGVLFTCLVSRAIHIEVAQSMDTDAFVNSMRRFIARRGVPEVMRSDNGSNFVSGNKELREAISEWNDSQVHEFLLQRNVKWLFNPPSGSHFGGV